VLFFYVVFNVLVRVTMPKNAYFRHIREAVAGSVESMEECSEAVCLSFMTSIKRFIDDHYKRPAHVYSQTKRLLRSTFPLKHPIQQTALNILRESPRERQQSETKAQQALEKRNDNVTFFSPRYVQDVLITCAKSERVDDIFIALQLACGCRQRDLFDEEVCSFEAEGEKEIVQRGSSKTKKPFLLKKKLAYMPSSMFQRLLAVLRRCVRGDRLPRWNKILCDRTKEYFPVDQARSGTHINRALYAAMMRHETGSSQPRSVQRALGHEKMSSSLHYLYVDLNEEKGFKQELSSSFDQ
jgi:hypothetical protein